MRWLVEEIWQAIGPRCRGLSVYQSRTYTLFPNAYMALPKV